MLWEIVFVITSWLFVAIIYWYLTMPRNLPRGPLGFPFVGTIMDKKHLSRQLGNLSDKYNSKIISFYVYNKLCVCINDVSILKEVYIKQGDKMMDRDQSILKEMFRNDELSAGNYGILLANGPIWREHRRFAKSTLRDFGVGKSILEDAILEEVSFVVKELKAADQQPLDIHLLMTNAVGNVVCMLVFGQRFAYEDKEFIEAQSSLNRVTVQPHPLTGFVFLKRWMLRFIPGATARMQKIFADLIIFRTFIIRQIKMHRESYKQDEEPKDYIHAYFRKRDIAKSPSFTDSQLIVSVADMFAAGTETTATTIRWAILFCVKNADKQEKVFNEIAETLGTDATPRFSDRLRTPYTEAFILETMRHSSAIALTGRKATVDIFVGGYCIPKGTPVFNNIWAMNRDPKYYPNPEEFEPERFLGEDGKLKRDDWLYPFSMGKRVCPGESLARMELYLFFAGMMQKFRFRVPNGEPEPTLEQVYGITVQPQPYKITAELRKS